MSLSALGSGGPTRHSQTRSANKDPGGVHSAHYADHGQAIESMSYRRDELTSELLSLQRRNDLDPADARSRGQSIREEMRSLNREISTRSLKFGASNQPTLSSVLGVESFMGKFIGAGVALALAASLLSPLGSALQQTEGPPKEPTAAVQVVEQAPNQGNLDTLVLQAQTQDQATPTEEQAPLTLQEEIQALRAELAEVRQENKTNEAHRQRQESHMDRKDAERALETGAAVLEGVVCILAGAISDSTGCGI